jgi:hypothetical protein
MSERKRIGAPAYAAALVAAPVSALMAGLTLFKRDGLQASDWIGALLFVGVAVWIASRLAVKWKL